MLHVVCFCVICLSDQNVLFTNRKTPKKSTEAVEVLSPSPPPPPTPPGSAGKSKRGGRGNRAIRGKKKLLQSVRLVDIDFIFKFYLAST